MIKALTTSALLLSALLLAASCTSECPKGENGDSLFCAGANGVTPEPDAFVSTPLTCANPNETSCQVGIDTVQQCADLDTSAEHCGRCGNACAVEEGCSDGMCVNKCSDGQVSCLGDCIDPLTNGMFCGASGTCTGEMDGEMCTGAQLCINGTCAVAKRYLGSLAVSTGRWNYGGALGIAGAETACRTEFAVPTAVICSEAHMIQAAGQGELINAAAGGVPVTAWWIDDATTPTERCVETDDANLPWTYPTKDLQQGSNFIELVDATTGTISALANNPGTSGGPSCALARNVACCNP